MNRKLLNLILFFSIISPAFSQSKWLAKKDKIVIPFELTHNLIIVEVEVNNVKLNMIFDTGSDKNLLFSFPENDSIVFHNSRKIKINGLGNGEFLEAIQSSKNKFKVKEYYNDNFEVLLITDQNISLVNKLGIPVNGIIGAGFFNDYLVEINYIRKIIFLHKNTDKVIRKKTKKHNKKEIDIVKTKPYLDLFLNIDGEKNLNVKLLFDTGLGDGLWLFENDSIKCKQKYIIDILGRGLGGEITGKKSRVEILRLNDFMLKDALVSYPDSVSYNQLDILKDRSGSLGGEILKRFNWFLDYQNKVFYFRKNKLFNEEFNYNMSGIEVQHVGKTWVSERIGLTSLSGYSNNDNKTSSTSSFVFDSAADFKYKFELKSIFEIHSVRANSPAAIAGLLKGDIIYSINGRVAHSYSIQKITDLFQSEDGKLIRIEVERLGRILEFKFKLHKIL